MGRLRSNGRRNWGNRDILLHGRMSMVVRVRKRGPFTPLLAWADVHSGRITTPAGLTSRRRSNRLRLGENREW